MSADGLKQLVLKVTYSLLATSLVLGTMGCPDDDDPDPVNDVDINDVANDVDVFPPPNDVIDDVMPDVTPDVMPDVTPDVEPDVVPDVLPPGTARVKIIHDVADLLAESVDVYLNGDLLLDDFEYGTATGFIEVDSSLDYTIAVAGSDSTSVDDAFGTFGPFTFDEAARYVVVVSGVLDPTEFTDNPGGADISAQVFTFDQGREGATNGEVDDVLIFHGVTDAPAVNIVGAGTAPTLAEGLGYGEFTDDYLSLGQGVTAFDVMIGDDRVGSWQTHSVAGGQAYVYVITGFVDATQNPQAPLRILAYTAGEGTDRITGEPLERAARIQAFHNSPDPDLATVDVWVNDEPFIPGFSYRNATPFVTVPSGQAMVIDLTPAGAADTGASVFAETVTLEAGSTQAAVVSGIDNDETITNPNGVGIELNLYTSADVAEAPAPESALDLVVFHGIVDAPRVDVLATSAGVETAVLIDDLGYGEFTGRASVGAVTTRLDVTPAGTPATVVLSFTAALETFEGQAALVVASGLLTPPAGYPGAVLAVVAPDGTVALLEPDVVE